MASTVTETKQFRKKLLSLNNLYKNTLYKYALKHGHFNNLNLEWNILEYD